MWQVLAQRQPPRHVAATVGVCMKTITKWCSRYLAQDVDGLHDRPRCGAPSRFSVSQRCEVLAIACDNPANYGYPEERMWTLDCLTATVRARVDGPAMSRSSIQRTLS